MWTKATVQSGRNSGALGRWANDGTPRAAVISRAAINRDLIFIEFGLSISGQLKSYFIPGEVHFMQTSRKLYPWFELIVSDSGRFAKLQALLRLINRIDDVIAATTDPLGRRRC